MVLRAMREWQEFEDCMNKPENKKKSRGRAGPVGAGRQEGNAEWRIFNVTAEVMVPSGRIGVGWTCSEEGGRVIRSGTKAFGVQHEPCMAVLLVIKQLLLEARQQSVQEIEAR